MIEIRLNSSLLEKIEKVAIKTTPDWVYDLVKDCAMYAAGRERNRTLAAIDTEIQKRMVLAKDHNIEGILDVLHTVRRRITNVPLEDSAEIETRRKI